METREFWRKYKYVNNLFKIIKRIKNLKSKKGILENKKR
jgi:hypothetical protein